MLGHRALRSRSGFGLRPAHTRRLTAATFQVPDTLVDRCVGAVACLPRRARRLAAANVRRLTSGGYLCADAYTEASAAAVRGAKWGLGGRRRRRLGRARRPKTLWSEQSVRPRCWG